MPVYYFELMFGNRTGRDQVGFATAALQGALREAARRGQVALAVADDSGWDWRTAMIVVRDEKRSILCAFRLSMLLQAGPIVSTKHQ